MTRLELIESFCNEEALAEYYRKPFIQVIQGGHLCATEGHFALVLPEDETDFLNYSTSDKPSFANYLSVQLHPFLELDAKDVTAAYWDIKTRLADVDRRCPECDGKGEVEYTYWDRFSNNHTKDCECPACEGKKEVPIEEFYAKKKFQFKLDYKYCFRFPAMERMMSLIDYFKLGKVQLLSESKFDQQPFHIVGEGFHAILAPALIDPNDDDDD